MFVVYVVRFIGPGRLRGCIKVGYSRQARMDPIRLTELGDGDLANVELLEQYPCDTRTQAEKVEHHCQRRLGHEAHRLPGTEWFEHVPEWAFPVLPLYLARGHADEHEQHLLPFPTLADAIADEAW